ncbi:MAG: DUF3106 domain-containing protein [Aquabacterium sp.]|uniref:DUF3106 domain-containing protein n=1 Tax=Aquabacterium sp. TaxID=1872578 RepID=UPI003BBDBC92
MTQCTWPGPIDARLMAGFALFVALTTGFAYAQKSPGHTPTPATAAPATDAPEWLELPPHHRQVLAPLASHWASMDDVVRQKWVNVANRYDSLKPTEQARMRDRMTSWSNLSAQKRGEARLRFQQARQLSPEERQRKWEAYRALPAEARQELTRQAHRQAHPVYLPDNVAGPREAKQAFSAKRLPITADGGRKVNAAPHGSSAAVIAPKVVAPATVQAGPGATTMLLTQPPMPPAHQQTGRPKISADKALVNPVTLLPRQTAAAVGSSPSQPEMPPKAANTSASQATRSLP